MSDVFPNLCGVPLAQAAGCVATIPRSEGSLLALVTTESIQKDLRSVVILNLSDSPSVVFYEDWRGSEKCLCYRESVRFELSSKQSDIDTRGNWWRKSGHIASINNEFFIGAAAPLRAGFRYVNVRTGAVLSGELPNFYAAFGVWSIWLRDPLRERSAQIFEFNIHGPNA
jgi:hypothetical protein